MPPFLMLLIVAALALLMMFGKSPMDKWREEQLKYGRDPLTREINKFNEVQSKKGRTTEYRPPQGATLYRLPPDQAQVTPRNPYAVGGEGAKAFKPAPEVPIDQWDRPYPNHMYAPPPGTNTIAVPQGSAPPSVGRGGTSIVPGTP